MTLKNVLPLFGLSSNSPKQVSSWSWNDRHIVLEPEVNLFTWQRETDEHINQYLRQLVDTKPVSISELVELSSLEDQIQSIRCKWEIQDAIKCDTFWQDVFFLTKDFLKYSGEEKGRLHLKVISNDACRKFHTDGYTLRLFTTYLGRGTEWLSEKSVNRSGLGKSNKLIVRKGAKINQMEAFEVGILKGEIPNQPDQPKGIVHRSPAIEHKGEKRIILRVDI